MEVAVNTCVALTRAVLTRLDNCAWIRNTCATLRPHVLQVEQVLNELRATESAKVPLLADALGAIERALSVMDTEISTWESDSKFKGFASANKRKEALQEAARALGDAMGLLPAANVQLTDKVRAGVQRVEGELGNLQVTFDAGVERLEAYERDILANVLSQGEDIGEMKAMLKFLVSTFASPSVDAAQEQRILEKVLTDKKCFKPGHEKEGITIAGNMAAEIRRMKEQEQKQSLAEALENLTIQPDCVKLGHPISHEGGSTVYGGVWDRDGTGTDLRNVAVKVVKVESGQISAEDVARIKKEAERVVKASHGSDHVCTLHGYAVDTAQSQVMLVMRRYPSSVSQRLRGQGRFGPLSAANKLQICCNIFQGLADLHAMGMCHYDMKPANVLLTEHGTAVLTDFQLSREANETLGKTLENEFGTLRYAPPEQMDRDSYDKPGTHSDMWSAAATVCEILSGEKPYHGMDLPGVLGALLTHKQPPKIPASVPAALRPLLQRCFSRDAQNRPTALEALETFVKLSAKDVEEGGTAAGEASETGTMSVGAVQAGRRDASVTTSNGDGRVRTIQVVRKMLADKTRKVVDLDGAVVTVSPAKTIVFAEEEYFSDEEYYDTEVRLVEGKKKLFGGRKMVETRVEVKKTRKIPKTRWSELAAEVPAGTRRTRKVVEFGDGLKLDRPGVTFRNASIEIDVPAADEYRCASPELVVVTAANVELENISVTVRGGGAEAWLTAMAVRMGGSVALSNCEIAVRGETGAAKYCLSVDGGGRASLANCTITCDRACTGLIAGTGSRLDLTQCRVSGADLVAADGGMLQLSDGALSGAQVCVAARGAGSVAEVSGCNIRHGGIAGQVSQGGAMELRDCTVFAARSGSTSLQVDGPGSVLSVRGGCVEGGQHAMVASGGALLLASACTLKDSISEEAIVTRGGGTRAELTESITYECLLRTDEGPGSEIAIVDETASLKQVLELRAAERREAERREVERREAERREAERREAERIAAERRELDRIAAERIAAARREAERREAERREAERREAERREAERKEAERREAERRLSTVDGLREALNAGSDKVICDLKGREVRGGGLDEIEVTRAGVTLRNGTLRGVRLVVRESAQGFRLESVTVTGYRFESDKTIHGAVHVVGASGVVIRACKLSDNPGTSAVGLMAMSGAKVTVEDSQCCGNGRSGVVAYHSGTEVTVRNTTCSNNVKLHGVVAQNGAKVTVEDSQCCGNGLSGVFAFDSGTEVTVRNTTCSNNKHYGVAAWYGAKVVGRGLKMSGNKDGNTGTYEGGVVDVQ